MRYVFFICALILGSPAAWGQSQLRVSLTDRTPINVSVDGRYFAKSGQSITVGDLPPGRHRLEIYVKEETRRHRLRENVIYDGNVRTHYGQVTLITLNAATNEINEQLQDIGAANNYQQDNNRYPPVDNNRRDYNNQDMQQPSAPVASPVASPVDGSTADAVAGAKIEKAKKKAAAKNTDTEKFNSIKESLENEQFTTAQVASIMECFSFESTKVDFAEWAYNNTLDKSQFSTLRDKLTYKTYREEFDRFLSGQK